MERVLGSGEICHCGDGSSEMDITLFKAFPDPYRQSMRIYADRLLNALQETLPQADKVRSFLPTFVPLAPRPARHIAQYLEYQIMAYFAQSDVNHIIDHAYGHLLYTLNPAKTVVTFHDAIGLKAHDGTLGLPTSRPSGSPRLIQRYNLRGLCRAAAIICVSEASRNDLVSYTAYPLERTHVIHEGVDESFFGETDGDPKKRLGLSCGSYILHVGHTRFYKNIPALFHVLAILTQSLGKDVHLLKVGEAFTSEQKNLAEQLGVWNRIIHLGEVGDRVLPDVYRSADILLFPAWYEGFGLPVLEAMASGLPIVASNRGALPEVAGDAAVLVAPEDHEAMAKGIAAILEQPGYRSRLRDAGLKRAREFTWRRTAQLTLNVYRQVSETSSRNVAVRS